MHQSLRWTENQSRVFVRRDVRDLRPTNIAGTGDPVPYQLIEDPAKLRRVLEATLLIKGDLELPALLGHVIEEARSMTGARYGALGVLNDRATALAEFVTVGLDEETEAQIGERPTGQGVLGLLIAHPQPMRLADIGSHPASYGFPANHPPMTSFLGVPIKVRDEVYGILYLTDKIGWSEFTADDEALVGALALGAGIAIENTRLHQRVQEVAIFEDRDRLARDLHDTVIQSLFAVGLSLQSMAGAARAASMADRLNAAVTEIDSTIRRIRSAIYELGVAEISLGIRASLLSLVRGPRSGRRIRSPRVLRRTGRLGHIGGDRRTPAGRCARGSDECRPPRPGYRGHGRARGLGRSLPTSGHGQRPGPEQHRCSGRGSGSRQPATSG